MSGFPIIERPGFERRLEDFETALFGINWVAERVMAGQQFNAYQIDQGDDEDSEPDEYTEYRLCIGPISDARFICDIEGHDEARLVEAALKVATEAFREKLAQTTVLGPKDDGPVLKVDDERTVS